MSLNKVVQYPLVAPYSELHLRIDIFVFPIFFLIKMRFFPLTTDYENCSILQVSDFDKIANQYFFV